MPTDSSCGSLCVYSSVLRSRRMLDHRVTKSRTQENSNLIGKGALEMLTETSAAYVPADVSYVFEDLKH